jgi:hypothetical protein
VKAVDDKKCKANNSKETHDKTASGANGLIADSAPRASIKDCGGLIRRPDLHLDVVCSAVTAKWAHVISLGQRIFATADDVFVCFFALRGKRFGELLCDAANTKKGRRMRV